MATANRRLSAWLAFGLIAVPGIAMWFTLRKGYSRTLRQGAFTSGIVFALISYLGGN